MYRFPYARFIEEHCSGGKPKVILIDRWSFYICEAGSTILQQSNSKRETKVYQLQNGSVNNIVVSDKILNQGNAHMPMEGGGGGSSAGLLSWFKLSEM